MRKIIDNIILERDILDYPSFLSEIRTAFKCGSVPGATRVTSLEFFFFSFFVQFFVIFSYQRQTTTRSTIGEWEVKSINIFYAFMLINGTLHGAKTFSNVVEDWIPV
jgi:hypothetical protein